MTLAQHDALLRHFADLRDGTHGGVSSRADKEALFGAAVDLLDPVARQVLEELNQDLLLGTGKIDATGVTGSPGEDVAAVWSLSWPEQIAAKIGPIRIRAHYGRAFHHPHLDGGTLGVWPLNVFTDDQAVAELPTLRAIAAAELHNLVFQADFRIVPATVRSVESR